MKKLQYYKTVQQAEKPLTPLDQEALIHGDSKRGKRFKRRIGGNFDFDTTLRAADGPYEVVSDLIVPPQSTLTIEKGTVFNFHPNIGLTVKGNRLNGSKQ